MSFGIILPSRWTRQPQGRVTLRQEAALGADLVVDGRGPVREILRGATVTVGSSVSLDVLTPGRVLRFAGGSTNSYIAVPISAALGTGEWTMVLLSPNFETFVASGTTRYGYAGDIGNANAFIADHPDPNPDSMGWYEGSARGCGPSIVSKQQYRMMAWRRVGNAVSAWLDGKTAGTPYTTSANLTATTLNLGGFKALSTAALHPVCSFDFALLYRRALNDAELQEIDRAPYGYTFHRLEPRIYVPSAGTGTNTYTYNGSGTVTLSGTATVARWRSYAGAGTVTLSGAATTALLPVVTYTYSGSGSVTLSGAAAVSRWRSYAGAGTVTMSGAATTALVPVGTTTYTYSGAGTVTLSGAAAVARWRAWAGSGTVTMSGAATTAYTPGLVVYTYAGSGTITLSGSATTTGPLPVSRASGAGKAKGKRARARILRDEQLTAEDRRRLGVPEPVEAAPEADQAPAPKRAKRAGKASRGIQLQPEPDLEAQRAAEILAQRTAELMAQQQAETEAMRAEGMAMLQAAAAIEADNELMMLLLMAA